MFCAAERGLSSFSKFQYTISDALSQHLIAGNGKEARRKRRGRLLPPSRTPLLLSSRLAAGPQHLIAYMICPFIFARPMSIPSAFPIRILK